MITGLKDVFIEEQENGTRRRGEGEMDKSEALFGQFDMIL